MKEKQKEEWIEAFEESKKITGFYDTQIDFKHIRVRKRKKVLNITTVAEYGKGKITVNTAILPIKYPKDIKKLTMLHEQGHHLIKKIFLLDVLINGPLEEIIADKFAQITLIKNLGVRKGQEIFKEYTKFYD